MLAGGDPVKKINGVGISSLLVIFAVLALTVFAVTAISAVSAEVWL